MIIPRNTHALKTPPASPQHGIMKGGRIFLFLGLVLSSGLFAQPTNVYVTPSSGSGTTQTFSIRASSPNGHGFIASVQVLFNWAQDALHGCEIYYDQGSNRLYLRNDQDTAWSNGVAVGTADPLINSQCQVNTGTATVTGSGNNLTVNVPVTFAPAFIGNQAILMTSVDKGGVASASDQQMGTWTAYTALTEPPAVNSLTPSSGEGMIQTFQLVASDINGYAFISSVNFRVGVHNHPDQPACALWYSPDGNRITLTDYNGTLLSGTLGAGAPMVTSLCSLDPGSSSVTASGNTLTIKLALNFNHTYASVRQVYSAVQDKNYNFTSRTWGFWTAGLLAPILRPGHPD